MMFPLVLFFAFAAILFGALGLVVHFLRKRSHQLQVLEDISFRTANLARALEIVWVETYGMELHLAPYVRWVEASDLNCYGNRGWTSALGCVAGLSWVEINTCAVAWPRGTNRFSDTSFAHELVHALRWHVGTPDANHIGGDFQPGGLVELANNALRAAGL